MTYEKILMNGLGDKLKISIYVFGIDMDKLQYNFDLYKAPKGKRTFIKAYDDDSYDFRRLSMEDRRNKIKQYILEIIGVNEWNAALKEAWLKLEPEYETK